MITAQVGTGGVRGVYLDDVDVLNPKVRSLSANGPVEGLEINRGHWPVAPTANVGWDLSEAIDPLVNGSIFDGGGTANVILAGGGASVTGRPIFTNLQMLNIPAVANYNALNLNNAPGARVRGGKSTGGLAGVNCRAVRLGAGSTGVVIEDHDVAGLLGISQFSILADTIKRRNPGDDEADTADPAVTAAAVAAKIETINTKINTTGGAYTLPEGFNRHHITLTASASALTLPDAAPGTTIIVYLKQGSTGSRTATLVAAGDDVIFPTNYVPTLSTTVGRVDRLVLDCVVANEWMIEPVVQSVR